MSSGIHSEVGSLDAPAGTHDWAVAVRLELLGLLKDSESTVRSLRRWIGLVEKKGGYGTLRDLDGKPFKSLGEFYSYPQPHGLGLSNEDLAEIKTAPAGAKVATLGKVGRPKKGEGKGSDATFIGRGQEYLTARLARDFPDVKVEDFPSVRQAAIAAGIVKVASDYEKAQKSFLKLDNQERQEFAVWIRGQVG